MKKKNLSILFLTLALLLTLSLFRVSAATDVTLETQPPADASDCKYAINITEQSSFANGYVNVTFNTLEDLHNMTFYRKSQKILMLNFDECYINYTEYGAPPPADRINITFYKAQWYNISAEGWETFDTIVPEENDPQDYFNYKQQMTWRALWQDDPVTPSVYALEGDFTITRGMPWVQVEWHITNYLGVAYNLEFVPGGLFYMHTDQTILSSTLEAWNETTLTYDTGTPWANSHAWFTVGFTVNGSAIDNPGMENNTHIFLNNSESELLDPLDYEAIIGDCSEAQWVQNFSFGEAVPAHCQYNYTFIMQNLDSVNSWHFAELWVPQGVSWLGLYFSSDNGTTWSNGIGYNWDTQEAAGVHFHTTNGTDINATIYDLSVAGGTGLNVSTSAGSDNPTVYNYSSLLGVYDRVAFGLSLQGDTGQDWYNSSSAAYIKVQVIFNSTVRYWFDYDYSNFEREPGQGYGLLNQTDGRLYFVNDQDTTAQGWAIGMNQTLRNLRITCYANRTMQNVLFSWNQTLADEATGCFIMNVFGYLHLNTDVFSSGDPAVPDVFEYGADTPRFQIHEALVKTIFATLQTFISSERCYTLNWTQNLTLTSWDSTGNYTVALVQYNRSQNGWMPTTTPTWVYRRSGSPVVDLLDSSSISTITFYLTVEPSVPDTSPIPTTPTTTPSGVPTYSTTGTPITTETMTWIIVAVVMVVACVGATILYKRRK
jgi:hypothetical protein